MIDFIKHTCYILVWFSILLLHNLSNKLRIKLITIGEKIQEDAYLTDKEKQNLDKKVMEHIKFNHS